MYYQRDDFDFEMVNFPFLTLMFLALHPMEFIFLNSPDLLEHQAMFLTSTLTINCLFRNFVNKAIYIINFAKLFWKFYRWFYF